MSGKSTDNNLMNNYFEYSYIDHYGTISRCESKGLKGVKIGSNMLNILRNTLTICIFDKNLTFSTRFRVNFDRFSTEDEKLFRRFD